MKREEPVVRFAEAIAANNRPDMLFSLAARAGALAATAQRPGALLVVQAMLLMLARRADDALEPREWAAIRRVCVELARLLDRADTTALDPLGRA